jgi:hypothetical protein
VRVGLAALVAALLVLLSACTGIGDASQTKACRALADQVPGISGVKEATFTDAVVNSLPRCSGVVVLDPGLSTAQRGQAVGSLYDVVRTRGVKEVEFNTQFSLGTSTLQVSSGFPTAEEVTGVLEVADQARASGIDMAWSLQEGLWTTLHATVSSTSPAVSLREGVALLRLAPPTGIREIDWYINDTQIISPNITSDEATHLEAIASWFEKNPGVSSYALTVDVGVQTWTLITTTETPDAVRDFAAIPTRSGVTVKVSASLASKAPYISIP